VHEENTCLVELIPEQAPLDQVWTITELGGVTSAEPFEVEQLPLQEYLPLLTPEPKQTLFGREDEIIAVPEHAESLNFIRYIWPSMHEVGKK